MKGVSGAGRGTAYRAENAETGAPLLENVAAAFSWAARARGLLGRPPPPPGAGWWLRPCGAIHTWGMRYPLDIAFLDRDERVVRVVRALSPWRAAGGGPSAYSALECAAGALPDAIRPGSRLTFVPLAPHEANSARNIHQGEAGGGVGRSPCRR